MECRNHHDAARELALKACRAALKGMSTRGRLGQSSSLLLKGMICWRLKPAGFLTSAAAETTTRIFGQ